MTVGTSKDERGSGLMKTLGGIFAQVLEEAGPSCNPYAGASV